MTAQADDLMRAAYGLATCAVGGTKNAIRDVVFLSLIWSRKHSGFGGEHSRENCRRFVV